MKQAQIILQTLVIIGYAIGLFPFGYLTTCWIVIPLTLVNFILSIPSKKILVDVVNLIMSILSLIPIIGFIPRIVGILLASVSISNLVNKDTKWDTDLDY